MLVERTRHALGVLKGQYSRAALLADALFHVDVMGEFPSDRVIGARKRLILRIKTKALIGHDRVLLHRSL